MAALLWYSEQSSKLKRLQPRRGVVVVGWLVGCHVDFFFGCFLFLCFLLNSILDDQLDMVSFYVS